ncbi:YfgM family protein [Kineobactrum salinum]|uniref:Ancillary SecYEG translocon subunit n=1 Tax=Kineobactrum salinum TaxID=2708301 RepID=A0A6C0UAN8_9GAMM|nr:tetratricopeptide repeat protein [Kineobactrum salinum]QIB66944.1 tetratricopeptide repeat protein [Kineobactrum salinum]
MESYRSEEEQVEALRRWWDENGRSTVVAIVVALAATFGWQGWQRYDQQRTEAASDLYQQMMQAASTVEDGPAAVAELERLAGQLRDDYAGTAYAQFAALQLARIAVAGGELDAAQQQLRWALGKADRGSEVALIAQLRLARVLAAAGEYDQALELLDNGDRYRAAYAMARGDVLAAEQRNEEALAAYREAQVLVQQYPEQLNLATLEAKLQSLAAAMPGSPEGGPNDEA